MCHGIPCMCWYREGLKYISALWICKLYQNSTINAFQMHYLWCEGKDNWFLCQSCKLSASFFLPLPVSVFLCFDTDLTSSSWLSSSRRTSEPNHSFIGYARRESFMRDQNEFSSCATSKWQSSLIWWPQLVQGWMSPTRRNFSNGVLPHFRFSPTADSVSLHIKWCIFTFLHNISITRFASPQSFCLDASPFLNTFVFSKRADAKSVPS